MADKKDPDELIREADRRALAAVSSTNLILEELVRRGAVAPCEASFLFDGRAVRQHKKDVRHRMVESGMPFSDEDIDLSFSRFCEVKALEILSKGFAVAGNADRVHSFEADEVKGDFAPGTIHCTVRMLAVRTQFTEDTE